ncbi:MAG: hypothetical protein H7230_04575 [Candidatus Parcubacteria bacterium]|nr:hypothetical protein [Candidatus Paceibacterota bacterium]
MTKESVGTVGLTYGDVFTFDSDGQIISIVKKLNFKKIIIKLVPKYYGIISIWPYSR